MEKDKEYDEIRHSNDFFSLHRHLNEVVTQMTSSLRKEKVLSNSDIKIDKPDSLEQRSLMPDTQKMIYLRSVFFNLFCTRHPFGLKKIWWLPKIHEKI